MPSAISLHVGLNSVDPNHYQGWSGPLIACEADAYAMEKICAKRGFATQSLLTTQATRAAVLAWLDKAARTLVAGDIAIISFSGHGGQLPDLNRDEDDGLDETWCLFDGELLDDELYAAWAEFAAGVRIVVFSDSCHSGTIAKNLDLAERYSLLMASARVAPIEVQRATYVEHQQFYDGLLGKAPPADPVCSVIQISGCQDNQLSMDGAFNGAFTGALLTVWANGSFQGSYETLAKETRAKLPRTQSPNYFLVGARNVAFEKEAAFSAFATGTAKGATRTLTIRIEDVKGVSGYAFQFEGSGVTISNGTGTFDMDVGTEAYLHWTMFGNPGGSMKVTVSDGARVVALRAKSTIPMSVPAGYDRLKLTL